MPVVRSRDPNVLKIRWPLFHNRILLTVIYGVVAAIPLSAVFSAAQRYVPGRPSLDSLAMLFLAAVFIIIGVGGVVTFNLTRATTIDKRNGTIDYRQTFFLFPIHAQTIPLSQIRAIEHTAIHLGRGLMLYRVDLRNTALEKIAWVGLFLSERRAHALALEIQKFLGLKNT